MRKPGFTPNPALVSFLGLCPLIGATANFASGSTISLATALAVVGIDLFWWYFRSILPARLTVVSHLALASFFALSAGIAIEAYSPVIAADLDLYIPLIMVNCLVLHELRKAGTPNTQNHRSVISSAFGYFLVAVLLSLFRETIGSGSITLPSPGLVPLRFPLFPFAPLPILASPAGGFMALAAFAFVQRSVLIASSRRTS